MEILREQARRRRGLARLGPREGAASSRGVRDDLERGILTTEISPRLAKVITGGFLVFIVGLPVLQAGIELIREGRVQAFDVVKRVPNRANLGAFEKEIERRSVGRGAVQPWLRLKLAQGLGFGTANVVLGRAGWLFYRPGIDWLSGPGLLDPTRLAVRAKDLIESGEADAAPDPRPAILAFQKACALAGVHLVVLPVPDKAALQVEELGGRMERGDLAPVPVNADFGRFVSELRAAGVDVFDPTPERVIRGERRFLAQDTHWAPEWVEAVADELARHLKTRVPAVGVATRRWSIRECRVSRVGDLVDMLELPKDQRLYEPMTVTLRQVLGADDGRAWQPVAAADVLLLGDSFSNIYCTNDLGWGEGAGFPAQLARFLGRDVDVIARNGSGASATRRELARRAGGLGGKKVVVWEFAARELMTANWDLVALPAAGGDRVLSEEPKSEIASAATPVIVEATIVATSRVPAPGSVPYRDCLTYVKLKVDHVESGTLGDDYAIAAFWGMKENVRLAAADYPVGKRLWLKLVPVRKAPVDLRTVRTADDLDDYEHSPYYVLEERAL